MASDTRTGRGKLGSADGAAEAEKSGYHGESDTRTLQDPLGQSRRLREAIAVREDDQDDGNHVGGSVNASFQHDVLLGVARTHCPGFGINIGDPQAASTAQMRFSCRVFYVFLCGLVTGLCVRRAGNLLKILKS